MKFEEVEALYEAHSAQPHDLAAQTALFQECYRLARAQVALQTFHTDIDVDDLAQDVVFAAWRSLPSKRPDTLFGFWLLNTLKSATTELLRLRTTSPLPQAVN